MSLQGPLIVVAETPATELTQALSAAGAFPIVEATWADAPTAFVSVKPAAVIIAEPGPPPSESSARMLCLQIATASGPIVPTIGLAYGDLDAALLVDAERRISSRHHPVAADLDRSPLRNHEDTDVVGHWSLGLGGIGGRNRRECRRNERGAGGYLQAIAIIHFSSPS